MNHLLRLCVVGCLLFSAAAALAYPVPEVPPAALTPASASAELEAISRQRFRDFVARNTASFKALYTPDFQAIGNDGKLVGIELLESILREAPSDMAIEPFAYRVMISADQTQGVVFHKSHDTWAGKKNDVAYTEVYTRRAGRWMLQFEQYTDVDPAAGK